MCLHAQTCTISFYNALIFVPDFFSNFTRNIIIMTYYQPRGRNIKGI